MADYNLKSITADTDGPSADTELLFGSPDQSSGTPKPYSFAGIKIWVKAWITKTDVGLSNVKNVATLVGFKTYKTGRYYVFPGDISGNSQATTAAGRIAFVPFMVPEDVTISALTARISTGSAGNWKGAIYASDATTLMPTGNALASGGNGSTTASSTNTDSEFSAGSGSNLALTAGTLYWRGINVDNTTATFVVHSWAGGGHGPAYLIGDTISSNVITGGAALEACYFTNAYVNAWPDMTSNSVSFANGNFPLVGFKVA